MEPAEHTFHYWIPGGSEDGILNEREREKSHHLFSHLIHPHLSDKFMEITEVGYSISEPYISFILQSSRI